MLLKEAIAEHLDRLDRHQYVILKLTLPDVDDFFAELPHTPNVLRVLALSGGYKRADANTRLARNNHVIASFSRALTEGLSIQQSDEEFDADLDGSIQSIFDASTKKGTGTRQARQ